MNAPSLPGKPGRQSTASTAGSGFLPDHTVRVCHRQGRDRPRGGDRLAPDRRRRNSTCHWRRVVVLSGDTTDGPDEMYTTSSLSISMSGGSLRPGLRRRCAPKAIERGGTAAQLQPARPESLPMGRLRAGRASPPEQDYWTVADEIDLTQKAHRIRRPQNRRRPYRFVGQSVPPHRHGRRSLPAAPSSTIVRPDNLLHARIAASAQSRRDTRLVRRGQPSKRAAKGDLQIVAGHQLRGVRQPPSKSVAQACRGPPPPQHAKWNKRAPHRAARNRRRPWLKGQPAEERRIGSPEPATPPRETSCTSPSRDPISRTPRWRPSCALAEFKDGHLTVWSHGPGYASFCARNSRAPCWGCPIEAITARHLHGAGLLRP